MTLNLSPAILSPYFIHYTSNNLQKQARNTLQNYFMISFTDSSQYEIDSGSLWIWAENKPVCLRGRELDFLPDDCRWQTLFMLFMFHIKQDLAEVWTQHGTSSILSPTHTHLHIRTWMDFLIPHFSHICTYDICSFCLCSFSNKAELEEDRFFFLDCFCLPTSALFMSFFADRKNCVFNMVFIVDLIHPNEKGAIVSRLVGQS